LITTNCAIFGLVLINVLNAYSFIESIVFAFGAGAGFTLALILMASIRERLQESKVPAILDGVPIALIVAGLLALAFTGFAGWV